MKTLYIDTHSTKIFKIGYKNEEGQLIQLAGNDASLEMISAIDSISKNEIEKIILLKGPGSLTGLRIGSSFAQGIALAKNIKVLGISIWDLIFLKFPDITVFFHTGTKKWITKTKNEELISETIVNENKKWISNAPNLTNFDKKNMIPYPNFIELIYEYEEFATENIDLLYPINLFQ